MKLRDLLFWRKPPISDLSGLADFIDEQSAFLVQKGIYEYSRARAGHYAKVLFSEQEFLEALERSRWSAYPLGLAMVGEVVEGILRPHAGSEQARQLEELSALVLSVFDRYPNPTALDRADLERCARRASAPSAVGQPACAQTRQGHSRALRQSLLGLDAHQERGSQRRFSHHAQLSEDNAVQRPR